MSREVTVRQALDAFVAMDEVSTIDVAHDDVDDPIEVVEMAYDEAGETIRPGMHELQCGDATRNVRVTPEYLWGNDK